jgi:hypothetical protein
LFDTVLSSLRKILYWGTPEEVYLWLEKNQLDGMEVYSAVHDRFMSVKNYMWRG